MTEIRPNYYRTQTVVHNYDELQGRGDVECFGLIDSLGLDFYLGNAMKYLFRAGKKDQGTRLEDLQKAYTYIGQAITKEKFGGKGDPTARDQLSELQHRVLIGKAPL